ncbi:hypothetical protein HME9302_02192 [Alteripontixanthobacter maritimus]|uniref:HIG1 domain-containing protein n=1 Tax=Alteripontixanthobacter maritimus TaxID=2161824 RepID=A0A369QBM2_9SPHN|nr:HIG1 domain-containing protein [Alteripontixanthobacter maritimus]RDC60975.1 hypothetical protein HME9302_02192 [Alteripontixanthobacter maritimus]
MQTFLIVVIVILCILVVVSLVRGIVAFMQSTKLDLNSPTEEARATAMQVKQNKMMFNRIKFQALAIIAVGILLVVSR